MNNIDNLFFQIQKMFSYLQESHRQYYDPSGFYYFIDKILTNLDFAFSYKDYEANPTNVSSFIHFYF